jgi:hypothetical protein
MATQSSILELQAAGQDAIGAIWTVTEEDGTTPWNVAFVDVNVAIEQILARIVESLVEDTEIDEMLMEDALVSAQRCEVSDLGGGLWMLTHEGETFAVQKVALVGTL